MQEILALEKPIKLSERQKKKPYMFISEKPPKLDKKTKRGIERLKQ